MMVAQMILGSGVLERKALKKHSKTAILLCLKRQHIARQNTIRLQRPSPNVHSRVPAINLALVQTLFGNVLGFLIKFVNLECLPTTTYRIQKERQTTQKCCDSISVIAQNRLASLRGRKRLCAAKKSARMHLRGTLYGSDAIM
jgi:hypothetical protein